MIDHTGITVSNLESSKIFYQRALAPLGYIVRVELGDAVGFGAKDPQPGDDPAGDFWLVLDAPCVPRVHIAFRSNNAAQVDQFHREALAAGARDNGAPGLRPQYHDRYYAAFVYDPDGYNVEAVCHEGR